jgi:hypothetical protein
MPPAMTRILLAIVAALQALLSTQGKMSLGADTWHWPEGE